MDNHQEYCKNRNSSGHKSPLAQGSHPARLLTDLMNCRSTQAAAAEDGNMLLPMAST
jgi:hypothetical protein